MGKKEVSNFDVLKEAKYIRKYLKDGKWRYVYGATKGRKNGGKKLPTSDLTPTYNVSDKNLYHSLRKKGWVHKDAMEYIDAFKTGDKLKIQQIKTKHDAIAKYSKEEKQLHDMAEKATNPEDKKLYSGVANAYKNMQIVLRYRKPEEVEGEIKRRRQFLDNEMLVDQKDPSIKGKKIGYDNILREIEKKKMKKEFINKEFMTEMGLTETVVKRGNQWCVVHGHPKKKGSKTDKPKGSIIKCHPTAKKAYAQHYAIMMSQKGKSKEVSNIDFMEFGIKGMKKGIRKAKPIKTKEPNKIPYWKKRGTWRLQYKGNNK